MRASDRGVDEGLRSKKRRMGASGLRVADGGVRSRGGRWGPPTGWDWGEGGRRPSVRIGGHRELRKLSINLLGAIVRCRGPLGVFDDDCGSRSGCSDFGALGGQRGRGQQD